MATATYVTNAEIDLQFPRLRSLLTRTHVSGTGQDSPLTELQVADVDGFPPTGTIYVPDSNNGIQAITYTKRIQLTTITGKFFFASISKSFADGVIVSFGDAQIDHFRILAKAWVNRQVTNPKIPAADKKDLEAKYVFYLVTKTHFDEGIIAAGVNCLENARQVVQDLKDSYPPAIGQVDIIAGDQGLG